MSDDFTFACHIVTRMSEIRNVDFPGILGWSGESVADCSCYVSLTILFSAQRASFPL